LSSCGLSGHAMPAGRSTSPPMNQMSPRFGADVLGTPRLPFRVAVNPLPSEVKIPRRLGVVPLWIGPQPGDAVLRAYDGMSDRPMDTAEAEEA